MRRDTRFTKRLEDPSPFPILTQDVDSLSTGVPRTDGTAGSPTRIASDAIRQVLGWRYRVEDLKGFQAALNKSFTEQVVDDSHVSYLWNRVGAATVDDTEITGALASFYLRTKAAIDQTIPLLDTLRPLRPDYDPENTEATRTIVRDRLLSLPSTLATPGGPPPQRIDTLFLLLLGTDPSASHANPQVVGGELGVLSERFGFHRKQVNTIEEELNLTNFLIVVDYVASLHQTWMTQRPYFFRGARMDGSQTEPYLGNQMVLIKNQLEVVADSVLRARVAMESVYFNLTEQQATFLDLGDGQPQMTVAELLDWVLDATQLTPDQMQSKDSLAAFRVVFEQVLTYVSAALNQAKGNYNNSTRGFYTQRVQLAFESLEASLAEALNLSNQIARGPRPEIDHIIPTRSSGDDKQYYLYIYGRHLRGQARVRVSRTDAPETSVDVIAQLSDAASGQTSTPLPRGGRPRVLLAKYPLQDWSLVAGTSPVIKPFSLVVTVINPDGQNDSITWPPPPPPDSPAATVAIAKSGALPAKTAPTRTAATKSPTPGTAAEASAIPTELKTPKS